MPYANELAIGTAGEHLVCADLLALGFAPFRAEQAAPYDVAVDVGERILRLQVKTTTEPRRCLQRKVNYVQAWQWSMRRGKGANRVYANGSIDGFALVALDVRRVAYLQPDRQSLYLIASGSKQKNPPPRSFDDFPFEALL